MIYLIDNQLPIGLVGHLQAHGLNVVHVLPHLLEAIDTGAKVVEIW